MITCPSKSNMKGSTFMVYLSGCNIDNVYSCKYGLHNTSGDNMTVSAKK